MMTLDEFRQAAPIVRRVEALQEQIQKLEDVKNRSSAAMHINMTFEGIRLPLAPEREERDALITVMINRRNSKLNKLLGDLAAI